MNFKSILYKNRPADVAHKSEPEIFTDLHLDQIIDKMTEGKEEYELKPFFYTSLQDVPSILYRQQIMQDLERPELRSAIDQFAAAMQEVRKRLLQSKDCRYPYQQERFFLDAVVLYCKSVSLLYRQLHTSEVKAEGFLAFNQFLAAYTEAEGFVTLAQEAGELLAGLKKVKYNVLIKDLSVWVLPYEPKPDYSVETERLYDKFRISGAKDYRKEFPFTTEMNRVEGKILEGVATLYPKLFQSLCNFYKNYQDFLDQTVITFDREIQFYMVYMDYCKEIKEKGAPFCYPEIAATAGNIYANETFDLALAHQLVTQNSLPVCNDFKLTGKERVLIVSGPNQGGKTTFARTFGQLHYLAGLGGPVPGRNARVLLFDRIYTHFEREEKIETHLSKFEEDLVRIHEILKAASGRSIVILNEIFSSTTLQDALFLNRNIMKHLIRLDAYCVWVTFIEELVSLSDTAVSMVSEVEPEDPAIRTFKITRKEADGKAYALSIAEKYHLTYEQLKARILS